MSHKPNPVALTAAMLVHRSATWTNPAGCVIGLTAHDAACLASELHRLAPAIQRHAVAMCNGEWRDGQRQDIHRWRQENAYVRPVDADRLALQELDKSIEDYGTRLDTKIAKINAKLAPLALQCSRHGDPRGRVFKITSTDPARPVGYDNEWPVA